MISGAALITTVLLVRGTPTLTPGTIQWTRPDLGGAVTKIEEGPAAEAHWKKGATSRAKPLTQIIEPTVLRTGKGDSLRLRVQDAVIDVARLSGVALDEGKIRLAYGMIQVRTSGTAVIETPNSRIHLDKGDAFIQVRNAPKTTKQETKNESFVTVVQKRGRTVVEAFKVLKKQGEPLGSLYGQTHIIPGAGKYLARGRGGTTESVQTQSFTLASYEHEYRAIAPEFTRGLTEASRLFAAWEMDGTGIPKRDFSGAEEGTNRAIASTSARPKSLFRRAVAPSQNFYGGEIYPSAEALKKDITRPSSNVQNW